MRLSESTSGKAHTTDEDYAKFSGQLVMTVSATQYDPKRKCWIKRTYEYIDIGRADPVMPVDAEKQLSYEKFKDGRANSNTDYAKAVNMAAGERRRAILRGKVVEYLERYGPEILTVLAQDLEIPYRTLYELLTKFYSDTFFRLPKTKQCGRADIYGLVGVHDKEAA